MSLAEILAECFTGSLSNVGLMAAIVIPLMVIIEIFKDLNLLDKLTAFMKPLTNVMGVSPQAGLPILAGVIFGINYGGGIIIGSAREGRLNYNDIYIINLFLVICHGIFEDTMLFAVIGARWVPVLVARVLLAVLVCSIFARLLRRSRPFGVLDIGDKL